MKQRPYLVQKLIGFVFTLIGTVFITIAIGTGITTQQQRVGFIEMAAVIDRVTSGSNQHGRASVIYEYEGQTYGGPLSSYNSSMREGDTVQIYVNPENPAEFASGGADFIWMIFGPVGALFFFMGIGFFVFIIRKNKLKKGLLQDGYRINAQIEEIIYNTRVAYNGRHPYIVLCSWKNPKDGVIYHFKSENFWYNPAAVIAEKGIETLPVYLNLDKLSQYAVSTEQLAGSHVYL